MSKLGKKAVQDFLFVFFDVMKNDRRRVLLPSLTLNRDVAYRLLVVLIPLQGL